MNKTTQTNTNRKPPRVIGIDDKEDLKFNLYYNVSTVLRRYDILRELRSSGVAAASGEYHARLTSRAANANTYSQLSLQHNSYTLSI